MKKLFVLLLILFPSLANAQALTRLCYPTTGSTDNLNCVTVSPDNPLPVNATVTATANTVAKATAAAPSYTEGSTDSLSMDLNGGLRVTGTFTATTAATATAAPPTYVEGSSSALSQDLNGDLRTIAKQGTSPWVVSNGGTFAVQATQSGTWNLNNISGTVSLPTGAATSAKQPALGSAGVASVDVLTVQGIASMTPFLVTLSGTNDIRNITGTVSLPTGASTSALQTSGNTTLSSILTAIGTPMQQTGGSVTANAGTNLNTSALALETGGNLASVKTNTDNLSTAQASSTTSQKGPLIQGAATTSAPTYTAGTTNPLSLTLGGGLRVDGTGGSFPVSGSVNANQSGTWTVQPGNTQNTTAWLVTGTGGTFPATQSGTWNINNVSGTVSLPTGAATAAKQPALGTAGAPSSDVISIQGVVSGTAVPMSAASLPLPTGAATSSNQTNGSQKTQIVDGAGNVIASTANNLNVQCANCSGSGASAADGAAFTAGTSVFAPYGGVFNDGLTAMTSGTQSMQRMTSFRAGHVNLRNNSGTEIGTSSNPIVVGGSASNASSAVATSSANESVVSWLYGFNGTTWDQLQVDASKFLKVNCASGCSGGTFNNNSDAVATSATNGQAASWLYGFNGTTYDRLRVDSGKNLLIGIGSSAGNEATVTASNALKVDGSAVTQPVSGTVTANAGSGTFAVSAASLPLPTGAATSANQPSNSAIGATTSGQTGNLAMGAVTTAAPTYTAAQTNPLSLTTAGALRVDGSAVTQPISGTVTTSPPANASTNVAQINGITPLMGNGVTGTGSQRVTIASDNTPFATKIDQTTPGTTNAVAVAQIGANTVLTGNGVTGTGSQRVTIASDNSPVAGMGVAATGGAAPANAVLMGDISSGTINGIIHCDSTAIYDASTTGSTQLVALTSGQTIYVCGYSFGVGGTATNVKLVYGTGTNCATGATNMTPAYQLAANGGLVDRSPYYNGMKTAASNALCINASAANAVQAVVYYTKY